MDLEKARKIFGSLYDQVNGRTLSLKDRDEKKYASKSFVYGEVVPDSFYEIIKDTNPQPGQVFYDLGSGTGKAVILAHLLFPYAKAVGIEFLDSLYQASVEVLECYEKKFKPSVTKEVEGREMVFIHGDLLDKDLRDADMVFINSTCFQDDLMSAIERKLDKELKPHAQVISLSKGIRTPAFYQSKQKLYEFSWGQATAFFHRKRLWNVYD